MGKIMNYIEGGKGSGLKYFLIFSLVFTLILTSTFGYVLAKVAKNDPILNDFIDRMPAIVIKNGTVVEPQNSFVVVPLVEGERQVFILNTTDTVPVQLGFDDGMYMTKNTLYVKNAEQVQQFSLANIQNLTLNHDTMRQLIDKMVMLVISLIATIVFIMLWISYGLIYLLITLFFLILGRPTCPRMKGRTIFLSLSTLSTLGFILLFFGFSFSIPVIVTAALILSIIIIFKARPCSMPMEESLMVVENESQSNEDVKDETGMMPQVKKTGVKKTAKAKTAVKKTVVKPADKTVKTVSKAVKPTVKKAGAKKESAKKAPAKKTSKK